MVFVLLFAGCEGGPKVVPVRGTLTCKGKPVTNATVTFQPAEGRPSWAHTDERGQFKLNYDPQQDGALLGKHKVSILFRPTTPAEHEAAMLGRPIPQSPEQAAMFKKYSAANSPLQVEITTSTRDIKLDLD